VINPFEKEYFNALTLVLDEGILVRNRTGIDTKTVFGHQMKFDLSKGFPALTTKKLAWKSVVGELLWFLEGSTDERRLAEIIFDDSRENLINKSTIWTANADYQGKNLGYTNTNIVKELGPIYGKQWRSFNGTDQLKDVINKITQDQDSRRIILSSWNVDDLPKMAIPPCHTLVQFRVLENTLNCQLYQRSLDLGLGAPFNIASYSLLTHMLAKISNLEPGTFVHSVGDMHIYTNHTPMIEEQLKRVPYLPPTLKLPDINTLDEILNSRVNDYTLENYDYHPNIKMEMAT